MQIGDKVIFRSHGEVKEGTVTEINEDILTIISESGEEDIRKFWEVNRVNIQKRK